MIEVEHLTKRYGGHTAVDDISFTVEDGCIYGLLGPNGAGKSTTMNIITGLSVGHRRHRCGSTGTTLLKNPTEAKACIGYLPELPPLYQDMTVQEYLLFVAELKGTRKKADRAAADRTRLPPAPGLQGMEQRLIRNLSKGYRQRVGIAAALLGTPKVIILDEPTVGLGPRADDRDPLPHPRPWQDPHCHSVQPYPQRGAVGLRPGAHHRPRQAGRTGHTGGTGCPADREGYHHCHGAGQPRGCCGCRVPLCPA